MIELSESNVQEYLRGTGRASSTHDLLVQSLTGGIANIVLKVFDPGAGARIGTDLRSPAQIKRGIADKRMAAGECMVLKQPLAKFRTQMEWAVDIDRTLVERDCMLLLAELLPAGSVPKVLWFDEGNYILAISCAPTDAVIWKKQLLAGHVSRDAATHAGMLLAMIHSATAADAAVAKRFEDPKLFIQQRTDAYLSATAAKDPDFADLLEAISGQLLEARACLIHGDYSPKNIFLVPQPSEPAEKPAPFALSHLMLLDFEVSFYGHPGFDVATLINHLLLKGFYHGENWRPFMLAADAFWQTYSHTADKALVNLAGASAGHILGALMLARVDGKSPVEYLTPEMQPRVRASARSILAEKDASLDHALDTISLSFPAPV